MPTKKKPARKSKALHKGKGLEATKPLTKGGLARAFAVGEHIKTATLIA